MQVETDGFKDADLRFPFRILLDRAGYQQVEYSELDVPVKQNHCDFVLDVARRHARVGDDIQGTATVRPLQDFNAKAVNARLSLATIVSYVGTSNMENRLDNFATTQLLAEDMAFVRGQEQSFPFTLTVPEDAQPVCFSENAAMRWFACCEVVPKWLPFWKSAPRAGLEINVYND